ncbi:hypothetical protein TH66_10180 [Carbonactinospora thermoautotrophica]|uniref:Uncharacterized protein n=1 Tax=Carbonactinospora thermoautotrophica TaxID=1469144 RepID=A0A132MW48_9ACTN|nr:hypothetical protein [Carbonactinospora thermoautotrophica]KWX02089.1 hypothetical protein LI90_3128 [Carbonactinospora thermoautotrophica]KWX03331.1 hypothetical protein TH66_10180 [Carbonactinospora thermoautotrophica]
MGMTDGRLARGGDDPAVPERVRVEIGELALEGFGPIDRDLVVSAFERELARLVRERGVPLAAGGDRALDLVSGLPELPATTSPHRLGEALARAVHAGLAGRGRRRSR